MPTFDPNPHVMKLKGKDYLEVKWRLVWFRSDHPAESGWAIITEAQDVQDNSARFMARVVDPEGRTVATGTKTETKAGFGDFVEKSETGAIGRALALLGYGTQFCGEELDEATRIVDSPVDRSNGGSVRPLQTPADDIAQAQYRPDGTPANAAAERHAAPPNFPEPESITDLATFDAAMVAVGVNTAAKLTVAKRAAGHEGTKRASLPVVALQEIYALARDAAQMEPPQ